jgi:molybdate transport system substrate-binding protein
MTSAVVLRGRSAVLFVALAVLVPLRPVLAAQELIVSAAASLTNAFKEIGAAFEKKQPDFKLIFNFAASGILLQQIERGAPVDVLATADQETMDQGVRKALVDAASRKDFTANRLVLVVPRDSTLSIHKLADLLQPDVERIALGKPETVPIGRYAQQALSGEKLWEALRAKLIYADNVRQVLDYVSRGEVDVGFVYATDATIAKDKVNTVLELTTQKPIRYPIAVLAASKQSILAGDFVRFVLSPEGQTVLAKFGFTEP